MKSKGRKGKKKSEGQDKLQRRRRRNIEKQYVQGECVWNALLRGIENLEGGGGTSCSLRTHTNLLRFLRARVEPLNNDENDAMIPTLFVRRPVNWNGVWLTASDYIEIRQSMLAITSVQRNGYNCRAYADPLLVTYCAAFSLCIHLDYAGTSFRYSTPCASRTVELLATSCHMEHCRNTDHDTTEAAAADVSLMMKDRHSDVESAAIAVKAYTCSPICGLLFPSKANMVRHQKDTHSTNPWAD